MGKGMKDKARFLLKDHAEPASNKGILPERLVGQRGTSPRSVAIPPGVPECDVILKGSKRFWYLEPALFIFGMAGFLLSAILLARHYWNNSISQ